MKPLHKLPWRELEIRSQEMFGRVRVRDYVGQDARKNVFTKREAVEEFKRDVLPDVRATYEQDGQIDRCARCEAWNNWTDGLCKLGRITPEQYATWVSPW